MFLKQEQRRATMRKVMSVVAVGLLAAGMLAVRAGSQTKAASGFDQLRSLVGTWQANTDEGVTINTIRLVSNDTAIEETFQSKDGNHNQMITMYTPDGARVAMTHYCSIGNQPHMQTEPVSADQKEFDFAFTGAGNLADEKGPHMHHMTLKIQDADHFTETWTMAGGGQERKATLNFVRTKG
jgi:hypothetical protein